MIYIIIYLLSAVMIIVCKKSLMDIIIKVPMGDIDPSDIFKIVIWIPIINTFVALLCLISIKIKFK